MTQYPQPTDGRSAVFLDRDGVLNESVVRDGVPRPPATVEAFQVLADVPAACNRLHEAGFLLIVVTNQPDIARATQERSVVEEMHAKLLRALPIDAVYMCPHDDEDRCSCRKPAPGLLHEAAHDYDLDLTRCVMVGDRWRDVEAGRRAGCRTVFIDRGYAERSPVDPDAVAKDLAGAANWIISCLPGVRRAPRSRG